MAVVVTHGRHFDLITEMNVYDGRPHDRERNAFTPTDLNPALIKVNGGPLTEPPLMIFGINPV
ncbi:MULTISPECIES: hypothetical protein [unclassified Thalassospira]|uniref:hypothetical protein n=1 Tax=unclassified Thalassospira TaxID=2648997 RepID=UPI001B1AF93C|nr:hypothetical protein [Thalassospira sp.]MBO6772339.1 hypothetical protein [Thalassospira sp.]